MTKKYVGYIRVSTKDQATEGHSLEAQAINKRTLTIKKELHNYNAVIISPKQVHVLLSDFLSLYKGTDFDTQKKLLRCIIKSIHFNFADKMHGRKITKIEFFFEPEDLEAQNFKAICGTVHPG